jgi:hypothetical protein
VALVGFAQQEADMAVEREIVGRGHEAQSGAVAVVRMRTSEGEVKRGRCRECLDCPCRASRGLVICGQEASCGWRHLLMVDIPKLRIPVFVSAPSVRNLHSDQENTNNIIHELLIKNKLEWRALGRSDFPMYTALREVK